MQQETNLTSLWVELSSMKNHSSKSFWGPCTATVSSWCKMCESQSTVLYCTLSQCLSECVPQVKGCNAFISIASLVIGKGKVRTSGKKLSCIAVMDSSL